LVGEFEGSDHLEGMFSVKVDLQDIKEEDVAITSVYVVHCRDKWRANVNAVMHLGLP
jgi:hypothetical protein